jgi:hypothetical protein
MHGTTNLLLPVVPLKSIGDDDIHKMSKACSHMGLPM